MVDLGVFIYGHQRTHVCLPHVLRRLSFTFYLQLPVYHQSSVFNHLNVVWLHNVTIHIHLLIDAIRNYRASDTRKLSWGCRRRALPSIDEANARFIYLFIYLSVYLSIYQFVYLYHQSTSTIRKQKHTTIRHSVNSMASVVLLSRRAVVHTYLAVAQSLSGNRVLYLFSYYL